MCAIKSFRIERPERARHALDQARPVQLLASLDNFFEGGSMRSWGLLILPVETGRPDVRFDCVRESVSERECEMRGDGPVI